MSFANKDLVVVIYDDLGDSCKTIQDNLRDLTRFKLQGGGDRLSCVETKTISQCLSELIDKGFLWAIVVAVGTNIRDRTLLTQTVEHAIAENSPLAGHLLDRGGYFHIHPQWFALDLKVYDQIGRPSLEETPNRRTVESRKIIRSSDNAHDDYTPLWLRADDSYDTQTYTSDRGYFGLNLIAGLIAHGYTLVNIPDHIRKDKWYCYPVHHVRDIERMIAEPGYLPANEKTGIYWFGFTIYKMLESLTKSYYPLNTEQLYLHPRLSNLRLDRYVGVCGGIKSVCIVGQANFTDDTKVVLFDISEPAIQWQKYLRSQWNGDFKTFDLILSDFQRSNPEYQTAHFQQQTIDHNIQWMLQHSRIDQACFNHYWHRYQQMEVEYHRLDMLEMQSIEWLKYQIDQSDCGTYIWLSNLLNMDWINFYKTSKWIQERTRILQQTLRSANRPYVLENSHAISFHGDFVTINN